MAHTQKNPVRKFRKYSQVQSKQGIKINGGGGVYKFQNY